MYRRDFMAGGIAAGFSLAAMQATARDNGTQDVRVAVIGIRGRGREHLQALGKNVAAVCDVDHDVLMREAAEHGERIGRKVATFNDYRELVERSDIDAVSIATPNHSHCLIAIAAIEAGKDVYVEKPVSHNIWEGRQLVAAAAANDRIVQCGTQCRSSTSLREAARWIEKGELGRIEYAIGTCYKPRGPIGKRKSPLNVPSSIDYDLWCGPAERRDLYREKLHYDWHWDWNTGNGDTGNQGIHQIDIARWFLGETQLPRETRSIGGRLGYDDAGNTPNTQVILYDYPSAPLLFETRGLPRSKADQSKWGRAMSNYRGSQVGVIVQCEGGHLLIPTYTDAMAFDRSGTLIKRWEGGGDHFGNWLQAVHQHDASLLHANIQEGHVSSAMCHVAGVSHLTGTAMSAEKLGFEIAHNDLLSDAFYRMAGHLRANGVDVDGTEEALTLGDVIEVDPERERYVNHPSAEQYFKRDYRAPFTVPDYQA